jgi:dCMP deaminase
VDLKEYFKSILGSGIVNGLTDDEANYYIQRARKPKAKLKPASFKKDEPQVNWNEVPKTENNRISKEEYYLNIAKAVSLRSTCLRRKYGAVIVKNDVIVSTGYNGAPRSTENCCDTGECLRKKLNVPSGERYELCRSVHAEQNAVISANRNDMRGATLYLAGIDSDTGALIDAPDCCMMCKRVIINSGITTVIFLNGDGTYRTIEVATWINNQKENSL